MSEFIIDSFGSRLLRTDKYSDIWERLYMEPETWKFDIDSSNLLKRKDTDRNEITEGEREKKYVIRLMKQRGRISHFVW